MYVLTVRDHFDAAHSLRGYDGECQRLHGHTWDIEVSVEGTQLDGIGILYDFKTLKDDLRSVVDAYDHQYLNEVVPFDAMNATAENLARVIHERLSAKIDGPVRVTEVAVWESPIARLVYRP
jgi:6-pyruvoyltetrahydropterin/6-carboxytetrahydropterin synthase